MIASYFICSSRTAIGGGLSSRRPHGDNLLTWLEQQNYYEVHEGAVESLNYIMKKLTKKNALTGRRKTGRDGDDWMSDGKRSTVSPRIRMDKQ